MRFEREEHIMNHTFHVKRVNPEICHQEEKNEFGSIFDTASAGPQVNNSEPAKSLSAEAEVGGGDSESI